MYSEVTNKTQWQQQAQALAHWAFKYLIVRTDTFPRYEPGTKRKFVRLTIPDLIEHFRLQDTIGAYTTDPATNKVKWGCIDFDAHDTALDHTEAVKRIVAKSMTLGIVPLIEESNGKGGFHIWFIWASPIPAVDCRHFLYWLLDGVSAEVFPKQDDIKGKVGNLVRLPGIHHKNKWISQFRNLEWGLLEDPRHLLTFEANNPAKIPPEALAFAIPRFASTSTPEAFQAFQSDFTGGDGSNWWIDYNCDFKTLRLADLFEDTGLLIGGYSGLDTLCPWRCEHTSGEGGTRLFQPKAGGWWGFNCLHAHCQGRGLREVCQYFGREAIEQYAEPFQAVKPEKQNVKIEEIPAPSIEDGATTEPTSEPKPEPQTEAKLYWTWAEYKDEASKEKTEWLVDGLLESGGLNILSGQSYAGKTVLEMNLVSAIILGDEWFNHFCKQTPVLYFNHDATRIKRVIKHLTRQRDEAVFAKFAPKWWYPIKHDYLFENLTPQFVDNCVSQIARDFQSSYNEEFKRPLIIIDTFRSAFMGGMDSGAEIDTATMFNVLRPFHKWVKKEKHDMNVTINFLHHNTKGADQYAGAASLPNLTDSLWNYTYDPKKPSDEFARYLTIKGRDTFAAINVTYDPLCDKLIGVNAGQEAKNKLYDDIAKEFGAGKIITDAHIAFAAQMSLATFQRHHKELLRQGRIVATGQKGGKNNNGAIFRAV